MLRQSGCKPRVVGSRHAALPSSVGARESQCRCLANMFLRTANMFLRTARGGLLQLRPACQMIELPLGLTS